jgi:hypothetical protein
VFTECAQQLALAVERPDSVIHLWLEKEFSDGLMCTPMRTVQVTGQILETVQQHLRRASMAINAKVRSLNFILSM